MSLIMKLLEQQRNVFLSSRTLSDVTIRSNFMPKAVEARIHVHYLTKESAQWCLNVLRLFRIMTEIQAFGLVTIDLSRVMRKPTICICQNKDADQLRGNREADQRLCFRYLDSTIPLLSKSKVSSFWPSPVAVQPGLYQTWLRGYKTFFHSQLSWDQNLSCS